MTSRPPTVLIVEDDPLVRELVRDILAEVDCTPRFVFHPDAVSRALATAPVDLILADSAGAGVGDVWPALNAVRDAAGAIPVLIFSAHPPARFADYRERGFAGVVSKPFTQETLIAAIRAHTPDA